MLRTFPQTAFLLVSALAGSGCSPREGFEVRTYNLGDRIELGHLIYTVFDGQWLTQLGEGPTARIPENRFFLVHLSVANTGAGALMVPTLTVADEKGKSYTELTNGDRVPQWAGFLRRLKPAGSLQGNVVFDAPPGRYKLRIADESEQRAALINIPFTFGSEAPVLPLPEKK